MTTPIRRRRERARGARAASAAVILLLVIRDDLGVGVADRSSERLDHLGDLGVPQSRVRKRRIHDDVIEAVATGAVAFDLVETRPLLQLHWFLLGGGGKRDRGSRESDDHSAHGDPPQATLNVTL